MFSAIQCNLHEMSVFFFSGTTKKKYFNMSSAENFTQRAERKLYFDQI